MSSMNVFCERDETGAHGPGYVVALHHLMAAGGLGGSLSSVHGHLCSAIKKSRDSGLFDLEAELVSLLDALEASIARVQPTLLFQPQQAV
mgnify:CR=1 FL=1